MVQLADALTGDNLHLPLHLRCFAQSVEDLVQVVLATVQTKDQDCQTQSHPGPYQHYG